MGEQHKRHPFVDEAEVILRAGRGGRGCVSFRREKHVPRGGPDGGDGGDGGAVILRATSQRHTLLDIVHHSIYTARNGCPGEGKNRTGSKGRSLTVELPTGTLVRDKQTGEFVCDLRTHGQEFIAARGGKGGRGNRSFATATNRTPTQHQEGEEGQERHFSLELKLIADVGLLGLPNAGKSTLLSRISKAHPRVAPYPFTTLEPQLGVMETDDYRQLVVADLPGLIEGAHKGAGLGDEFLRHVERTRVLVHLVDVSPTAVSSPTSAYDTVRHELTAYSEELARKPELVAATKVDTGNCAARVKELADHICRRALPISAITGEGLPELTGAVIEALESCS